MSKKLWNFICCVVMTLLILGVGSLLGCGEKQASVEEKQKIVVTTMLISDSDEKTVYTTEDAKISIEELNIYSEIINSSEIKDKISEEFTQVNNIELESVENTRMVRVIYVCDDYNENECIEINKKFVSMFREYMLDNYNLNISILESASIGMREVEK